MIRSFVAVPIPGPIRAGLGSLMEEMGGLGIDARFPRPEAIHLTLKFLGDVEEDRLPAIGAALAGVAGGHGSFRLNVGGLGVFPHLANPRVVWTGVHGEGGSLAVLQGAVEAAMNRLGFPAEDRGFQPHLTLVRVRSRRKIALLIDFLERKGGTVELGSFPVSEFQLYRSVLRPEGAQYSVLQSFQLVAAGSRGEGGLW